MVAAMDIGMDTATVFMATGTIGATGVGGAAVGVIIQPGVIIRTAIGVMAGVSAGINGTKGGCRIRSLLTTVTVRG